ncbi:hypothetical protein C0J52_14299 [Blattella germanica]|nr:hypothetical protein C0J52_14299 [Blattella germanica]
MGENTVPTWLLEEDALSLHKQIFPYFGLLPGNTTSEKRRTRIIGIISCTLMTGMVIGSLIEAYQNLSSFKGRIASLSASITQIKCLLKTLVLIYYEDDVRYLLDKIMENFQVCSDIEKEKIISTIRAKKRTAWWITVLYIGCFLGSILLVPIESIPDLLYRNPLATNGTNNTLEIKEFKRRLPLRVWLPIDEQKTPYYEIGFFYQMIFFTYEILTACSIDTFIAILIMYASVQFELLGSAIEDKEEKVKTLLERKLSNEMIGSQNGPRMRSSEAETTKHIGKINLEKYISQSLNDDIDNIEEHASDEWNKEMFNYLGLCVKRHQSLLE